MKNLVGMILFALVVLLVRDASAQIPCEITGIPNGTQVWSVLGQVSLAGNAAGNLTGPDSMAIDPITKNIFVANSGQNVISVYNGTSFVTRNVSGPLYTLGTGGCNTSGLIAPTSIIFSPNGSCFISDQGHSRVLRVDNCGSATPATFQAAQVFGQPAFNVCTAGNFTGNFSGVVFNAPGRLAFDPVSNSLFVPDINERVVFVFKSVYTQGAHGTIPSIVLGKSRTPPGVANANSFKRPSGCAFDSVSGALFVSDFTGGRVLRFNNILTATNYSNASIVFGQTTFTGTTNSTTSKSLDAPNGLFASGGVLYVTDSLNSRVLGFAAAGTVAANDTAATFVLGQPNFNSSTGGAGETFNTPASVWQSSTISPVGSITMVADQNNNRIVIYLCKSSTSGSNSNSGSFSGSASIAATSGAGSGSTSNSASNAASTSASIAASSSISVSGAASGSNSVSGKASASPVRINSAVTKSTVAAGSSGALSSGASFSSTPVVFRCHRPCRNACAVCSAIGGTCKFLGNGRYQCVSPRSAWSFRYRVPGRQTCPPTNGKPHLTALCKAAGGTFTCNAPNGNKRSSFTIVTCSKF